MWTRPFSNDMRASKTTHLMFTSNYLENYKLKELIAALYGHERSMQVVSFGCCVLDVCYIGYIRLVISYWCCVYVRGDNAPGNACPWTFLSATCSQQMSYAEVECAEETFLLAETDRIALWTFYGQKIRKYFPQILSRTWMKIKKKQQEQQQHKVAAAVVFFFLFIHDLDKICGKCFLIFWP